MNGTVSREQQVDSAVGLSTSTNDIEIAAYLYDMLIEMEEMCVGRDMRVVSKVINFAGEEVRRFILSKGDE